MSICRKEVFLISFIKRRLHSLARTCWPFLSSYWKLFIICISKELLIMILKSTTFWSMNRMCSKSEISVLLPKLKMAGISPKISRIWLSLFSKWFIRRNLLIWTYKNSSPMILSKKLFWIWLIIVLLKKY